MIALHAWTSQTVAIDGSNNIVNATIAAAKAMITCAGNFSIAIPPIMTPAKLPKAPTDNMLVDTVGSSVWSSKAGKTAPKIVPAPPMLKLKKT
mmetsp:Transcript_54178/g.139939  ORF Transcript_54178/g.139939 Transcript_54178/m.139939 type:complete len:93 (-) Transcript_54178:443-721(-)